MTKDPLNPQDAMIDETKTPSFAPRNIQADRQLSKSSGRGLRYALLASGMLALVGVITLLIQTKEDAISFKVTPQEAATDTTEKTLTLEGVVYKGQTSEGEDFVLFADRTAESPDEDGKITMIAPRAKIDQPNDQSLTIRSNEGVYFQQVEHIHLSGRVVIVQPETGYTLYTEAVSARLEEDIIESLTTVRGFGPSSSITADGMIITNRGRDVVFVGNSALVLEDIK